MSGGRDAQRFDVCNCEVCGLAFFTRAARDGHQAAHTQADADREEVRTDGGADDVTVADSWTLTVELTLSPSATEYRAADVRDRLDRLPGVRDVREIGRLDGEEADRDRLFTDGSGHVCDACGTAFETLTALRLHEKDECPARATYAEIDPDDGDVGNSTAEALMSCRDCGWQAPPTTDWEYSTSFDGEDYHYIVTFDCPHCGFDNENRAVMTGVDAEDLSDLPPHLQPDDPEVRTDGRGPEAFERWVGEECPECGVEIDAGSLRSNGWALEHKNPLAHPQAGHHVIGDTIGDVADEPIADGWGVPLAGDPPDRDARVDDLDDTLVADPESGTRYVVSVRSGELVLLANGDPREGVEHETPASLWHKYQHGQYYAPDPDRSPWPVLDELVGGGEGVERP